MIVVIDTGININHEYFRDYQSRFLSGYEYLNKKMIYLKEVEKMYDNNGHGTGVNALLCKYSVQMNILNIIIKDYENFSAEDLQYILNYIKDNIDCNLVHLSCGIPECYNIKNIYDCCSTLYKKGIYIVSAFDNTGCQSYPAVFDNVIGIDFCREYNHIDEFDYYENSMVNIKGACLKYLLPDRKNNDYQYCEGTSFLSIYFTALIANYLSEGTIYDFESICNKLKEKAQKVYVEVHNKKPALDVFEIKKAIVFPFNKEIHSLLRFQDMLNFEIKSVLDSKYMGNINRTIGTVLQNLNDKTNLIVENIEKFDWEGDFDTVILGHLEKLEKITKQNYFEKIIEKCAQYNKKIYILDDMSSQKRKFLLNMMKKENVFFNSISTLDMQQYNKDKLYRFGRPILSVLGTSSRQGKFTLQLELRKRFLKDGYKVGQLGTEPTSKLFGFEEMIPFGYNASVHLNMEDMVFYNNSCMHEIGLKEPDIIIIGSQSQTVNSYWGNQNMYPYEQYLFLLATEPDAYILCINADDSVDYIKRTQKYIESITCAVNVGIVLFPMEKKGNDIIINDERVLSNSELQERVMYYEQMLDKKVYILGDDTSMENLYLACIDAF